MRIVVLSDTYIPKRAKKLPDWLTEACMSADLIIHAGDWQTEQVYEEIKSYGPLAGVTGNVDSPELGRFLNEKEIISAGGYRIGIVHDMGSQEQLNRVRSQLLLVQKSIALFLATPTFLC